MSFRRMTRMISFRVSQEEFEELRARSEAQGARSVSDYARFALCGPANDLNGNRETDIHELNSGIQLLSTHIQRLAELMENPQRVMESRSAAANGNGGDGA